MIDKTFEVDGIVVEALPEMRFIVEISLGEKRKKIMSYLSGKIKINYIKIVVGDKVKLEIKACDPTVGRIIYRY